MRYTSYKYSQINYKCKYLPLECGCTLHTMNPKAQLAAECMGGRDNIIWVVGDENEMEGMDGGRKGV